jgi:hypothetical protein
LPYYSPVLYKKIKVLRNFKKVAKLDAYGYASIRKVPDYKPMMPLLRLSRAVAAVGFTIKRGTWEFKNSKLYQHSFSHLESLAAGENR